jgi:predicted dehydrogenase
MATSGKKDRVRVGIIGTGQIGKMHLERYRHIAGAEVVAVADINESEARRVAANLNIPHVYTDFRELLSRDDIDAVDVCLHNVLHRPVTVAALEAGKDVFCEKPMAGTYADARLMFDAARNLGRKLGIQFFTLFLEETRAAKALIDGGHLGEIYHARSTGFRRRGRPYVDGYGTANFVQKQHASGGAIYDMGVYHIAQVLYLTGNPTVQRITGKTYQKIPMDPRREQISGYDVEELGLGFVRFDDDFTLDIIEAWAIHLNDLEGSRIVGSAGGVRLSPFGYYRTVGDLDLDGTTDLEQAHFRWNNVYENGDAYESPQHHWIAALQGRVELVPTDEIALNTMLIAEGMYLSDRLGREVTADEVKQTSVPISPERL